MQAVDAELAHISSNVKSLESQLSNAKARHASEVSELKAEVHSTQQMMTAQQLQIDKYEATLQSEHVDADNRSATMDKMRTRLKTLCALVALPPNCNARPSC